MTDQIERVLFLSKMESGEYTLKKEKVELATLLYDVVDNMSLLLEAANGEIELEVPSGELQILGDRTHLSNVFKNLIDNAIKYCDIEPKIRIVVKQLEDTIQLNFEDNGIGICEEDQKSYI